MSRSPSRHALSVLIMVLALITTSEAQALERGRDIPRIYKQEGPLVAGPARLGGYIGRGIGTIVGVPMVVLAAPLSLMTLGAVSPLFPIDLGRDIGGTLGPHFGGMPAYIPKNLLMDLPAGVYHAVAGNGAGADAVAGRRP